MSVMRFEIKILRFSEASCCDSLSAGRGGEKGSQRAEQLSLSSAFCLNVGQTTILDDA